MRLGLFTTGGTIGMRPVRGGGVAPSDGACETISNLPDLPGVNIEVIEVFAKPSASVTLADMSLLSESIEAGFAAGIDAAVVTHGTDTLEESAFALSLMLKVTKPVVVTGAMRSPDQLGADGPANLLAAITVALHPEAAEHGVLVVFGDEIHSASLVQKVHTSRVHAFSSAPNGPVGHLCEGRAQFVMKVTESLPQLRLAGPPPPVPILQASLDLEPTCIEAFAHVPIGGLIVAGVGGGHVSEICTSSLQALARRVPVVITSRVNMGPTLYASYGYAGGEIDLVRRGLLNGGHWRPCQARILLQLILSSGRDLSWTSSKTLNDVIAIAAA